jgi:DNA-binding MarR family transcriptional regulator
VLYEIVRVVAEEAARRHSDPLKDPRTVAQRAWEAASRSYESVYGAIPKANEVQRQLAGYDGRPFAWPELLEFVFDESRDIKKRHEDRMSAPERAINHGDIEVALLMAANALSLPTVLPDQYEELRDSLIAAAATRLEADAIAERLPTRSQIEREAGDWDKALEIAGLEPRSAAAPLPSTRGASMTDAIVRYYASHGNLPTSTELREYAVETDFALEGLRGMPWAEHIEAGITLISDLDLPLPPQYGVGPPDDWQPITLDGDLPPRRSPEYTRVGVMEAVVAFVEQLPARQTAQSRRWRTFSRGKRGVPSLKALAAHGGLDHLVRETTLPGWRERARVWDDQHAAMQRKAPTRRSAGLRRHARKQGVQKRVAILRYLRDHDAPMLRDIAKTVNLTSARVSQIMQELEPLNFVKRNEANARSSKQTYSLTPHGSTALADIRKLKRTLGEASAGTNPKENSQRVGLLLTVHPALRQPIAEEVARRQVNANDLLVGWLAEHYGVPFTPTKRRGAPSGNAPKIQLRMSGQLKQEIKDDAYAHSSNMTDTTSRLIAQRLGIDLALPRPTRTTPFGGGESREKP